MKTAMSFRLPGDLRARIEAAAGKGNVSQWLIEAAEDKLAAALYSPCNTSEVSNGTTGSADVVAVDAGSDSTELAANAGAAEDERVVDLPMPDDEPDEAPPSQAAFYAPETVAKPVKARPCPICRQPLRIDEEERMWYCDGLAGCKAKGPVHDSETA